MRALFAHASRVYIYIHAHALAYFNVSTIVHDLALCVGDSLRRMLSKSFSLNLNVMNFCFFLSAGRQMQEMREPEYTRAHAHDCCEHTKNECEQQASLQQMQLLKNDT